MRACRTVRAMAYAHTLRIDDRLVGDVAAMTSTIDLHDCILQMPKAYNEGKRVTLAIASISTSAPSGSRDTSTQERAGKFVGK